MEDESNKSNAPEGTGEQLWEAAYSGQVDQVQALCERWGGHGEVINWAHPEYDGNTPLHSACFFPQCTAILVSTPGCEVNKGDDDGRTPLFVAAISGLPETVQALLAAPGIDLNKAPTGGDDEYIGKSPLAAAEKMKTLGPHAFKYIDPTKSPAYVTQIKIYDEKYDSVIKHLKAAASDLATKGGKKHKRKSNKKHKKNTRKTKKNKLSYKRFTKKTK